MSLRSPSLTLMNWCVSVTDMRFLSLAFLFFAPAMALAQRDAIVPDPDPEIERKSFIVDPRFEVNLFAADPLLAKPIQMNWDAAGRLWIASSEVYPQIKPGQKANDKIIILEDTKGTGKADKTTVFADGLLVPTGLEPGDGGVYVANSTELIHLSDTDGDGKADKRRIVLSGFGTEDTHHMLHTLRWGPDGLLYMMQSIYIHSHIETPFGPRRLNAGGIWQFNPHTMRLEVFARGWINAWGLAFDKYGNSFVTDGAGNEGINFVIPGGYYVTAADAKRVFPGLNPGSPKYCGLEVTSGRHLPDDWQGNLITNDFRGHRVCRFILKDDGAGFAAIEQPELIKSNHPAFRPIDVKMGPDGAIYVADWYNPIIQHGEVDFRDPRRDVTHGRIWRVTAKNRALVKRPKLVGATTGELLESLKQPEQWTRDMARQELLTKSKDELVKALRSELPLPQENDKNAIDAYEDYLHAIQVLGSALRPRINENEYISLVENPKSPLGLLSFISGLEVNSPLAISSIRLKYLRNIGDDLPIDDNETKRIGSYIKRESPRGRLEMIRMLSQLKNPLAVTYALQALNHPMDRFLDYALFLTVRELEPQWLPAFHEGKLKFDDHRHLLFAVHASGSPQLVEPLLKLLQQGDIKGEIANQLWAIIAQLGGPGELRLLWDQSLDAKLAMDQRIQRLQALEQAARQRQVIPAGDLSTLASLLKQTDPTFQAAGLRLVGLWKQSKLQRPALAYLEDRNQPAPIRVAALDALAGLGGPENLALLQQLSTNEPDRSIRLEALLRLVRSDLSMASPVLATFCQWATEPELTKLMQTILQQKGGPQALTSALGTAKISADLARIGQRLARTTGQPHQPLIEAFARAGNLSALKWTHTPELVKELVDLAKDQGNAQRGEMIYRRAELNCMKCHAIGGAGGTVGPDLSSIGASAQPDYLVDSILAPSKAIKENYHTTVVSTTGGKILTGVKQLENNQELVLRDAEDKEVRIPIGDIEERTQGKSLMPEGAADNLTKSELVDLIRFLTDLGKVGPFSVGTSRVARTWQCLQAGEPTKEFVRRTGMGSAASNDPRFVWSSEYATVAGQVPLDGLPDVYIRSKGDWSASDTQICVIRTKLQVSAAGEVLLALNSIKGLQGWVGQSPINLQPEVKLKLTPGTHYLTFALDKKMRQEGLRIELKDVKESAANPQWVK